MADQPMKIAARIRALELCCERVSWRPASSLLAPSLAWALLAGCASQAPVSAPAVEAPQPVVADEPVNEDATATPESPVTAADAEAEDPVQALDNVLAPFGGKILGAPGEEWRVDDEGRRYYLIEIERQPHYKILPNGFVMLPPGAAYELAEEREDTLVVRIVDTAQLAATKQRQRAQPGRAEMVADLGELEVESFDRLRFTRTGADLPDRGQWRQGFELADMNGDGNLDLVHGPPRKSNGKPRIFLGDGAGGWRLWSEARYEGQPLDYGDVAVADFDGDGELDLALAVHLRGLVVLLGDGEGTFTQWSQGLPYWVPGSGKELQAFSTRTVEAIDWDRDGRPDLLTLGEGPRLIRDPGAEAPGMSQGERGPILFLNRGEGRWERYDQGTGKRKLFGDGLAVGDFDGDGRQDFAMASRVSGGTKVVKMGTDDGGWEDVSLVGLVRPGIYGAVHAVDLDGDGRDEVLLGYAAAGEGESWWTGLDLVELEAGEWRRQPLVAVPQNLGAVTALATGDLDRDGRLDIAALTGSGERWILLATGERTFVREESPELAPSELECQGYEVMIAPVGEGGAPVLIMGFAGESGSESIVQTLDPTLERRCPSGGSLEAWSVEDLGARE